MGINIVERLLSLTLIGSEWVLWLLIFLSVASVAIIFERALFFARTRNDFRSFTRDLTARLVANDTDGVRRLCEAQRGLESQMVLRGVEHAAKGVTAMDESMSGYLIGERQTLDQGLVVLGTLGNNAPFIGLFGTVIGIIQAFHNLSSNPGGGPSVVMSGISEALVATAVGLVVAIPAVVAYNGFLRVVKRRLANAEAVKRIVLTHYSIVTKV
jgi:biopolymer transport protein ExbB